jgi:hypothetical protein
MDQCTDTVKVTCRIVYESSCHICYTLQTTNMMFKILKVINITLTNRNQGTGQRIFIARYLFVKLLMLSECFLELEAGNQMRNYLTLWSRALFEKLIIAHVIKTFRALYGSLMSITVFIRAHHWTFHEPDESSPPSHIVFL